ncbi:MAG: UdgX family uracil-DNA binding protein [Burkholderiaceae bacterium]
MPTNSAGPHCVTLAGETDLDGFRRAARRLIAHGVEPIAVSWQVATAAEIDLFGAGVEDLPKPPELESEPPALRMPAFVGDLAKHTLLHADPERHALMYRLLWRLTREPALRHDPLDPDRMRAEAMARAVRRDRHKMTAFVRFRPLEAVGDAPQDVLHVAWFEPQHHIVEAVAPFFARRFAQMRWAILTPRRSVRWDGQRLAFGPGARSHEAPPADAGEQLWLTYYEHIFNPARLKLAMMQKEMPRRYWPNLPEAALIQPLAAAASRRAAQMVEQGATEPTRRRPVASSGLRIDARVETVAEAGTLEALGQGEARCRECPISTHATQAVPGEGPLGARLMLVGEQPGDQEDLRGRPFVGPAGMLLDRALAQLGWSRDRLYLTNAVKHFKFELRGKRRIHKTPAQREAAACLHWLESEIAIVRPGAAVALGATAARALLGREVAVLRERGRWQRRDDGLAVLVTLHPSALLRLPDGDREAAYTAWLDDLSKADVPPPVAEG